MKQHDLDKRRRTYRIDFPSTGDSQRIKAWFRQVGTGLYTERGYSAHPAIAFETVGTSYGTRHYMTVPWMDAEHLVQQLHGLAHGVSANYLESGRPKMPWNYAAEFDLTRPDELLPLDEHDSKMRWIAILNSMSSLVGDEAVMIQYIVRPLSFDEVKPKPMSTFDLLRFRFAPQQDQRIIESREAKSAEPSFAIALRIAAHANTESRASHLVNIVYGRIAGDRGFKRANVRPDLVLDAATHARSPREYHSRLTASELTALVSWPLGNESVIGLSRDSARHRAPSASVLTTRDQIIAEGGGIKLGTSTVAGREQTVALDYNSLTMHGFFGGGSGSGKTTAMSMLARQVIDDGKGLILLDPKGDLFREVSEHIPRSRYNDVVVIDFTNGLRPVGFNILEQGDPRTVVDELVDLFQHKYRENGVYFRDVMFHGLSTLAELGLTFNDLRTIVMPRNDEELKWSQTITSQVVDRELQRYWRDWWAMKEKDRLDRARPIANRIWQLTSRRESRYMLGQAKSGFYMDDIIRGNKILLVNVSGVAGETAEIIGTLLFNAIWSSAQRVSAMNENFLLMDEFHMFSDIPFGFDEMLAMARKFKLCVYTATQYTEQLTRDQENAIFNNARNKVILTSEYKEASTWARFFGGDIRQEDISNLPEHVAMTRLKTPSGMSPAFTMKTLAPIRPYYSSRDVAKLSMERHGRSVADIEAEEEARRMLPTGRKLSDQEALQWKLNQEDGDA